MHAYDPTTIYFIRHGESLVNITREFSCRRADYPLTERGIAQARQTAEHLQSHSIAAIYSSPLQRATQTAEIVAETLGLAVMVREAFREVDVGRLEDEPPTEENWARYEDIFAAWLRGESRACFPGGECQDQLLRRMRVGLGEIVARYPGREVVVVAHGGILWAAIGDLCPNARLTQNLRIGNCAITEMVFSSTGGTLQGELRTWAGSSHLAEPT